MDRSRRVDVAANVADRILRLAEADPRPPSDQIRPDRRAVDHLWSLAAASLSAWSAEKGEGRRGDVSSASRSVAERDTDEGLGKVRDDGKDDSKSPFEKLTEERRETILNLLAFSPDHARLWEKIKDGENREAFGSRIVPELLVRIREVAPLRSSFRQREALARLALNLVWSVSSTKESKDSAEILSSYGSLTGEERTEAVLASLDAATRALTGLKEDSYGRETQKKVQAVAELFGRVRSLRQIPSGKDWQVDTIMAVVKRDWEKVGRFQEISPYRLHAVHFYTGVLETVPEAGSRASLRKALDRAKGRKRDRDRRRDDLPLKPGSMHEEGRICVRFLGNSKFIHVEDLNEGRRARFSLVDFEVTEKEKGFDNTERGKDAGIVSGELSFSDETSDKTAWSVEYEWQESDASLRIKLPSGRWLRAER